MSKEQPATSTFSSTPSKRSRPRHGALPTNTDGYCPASKRYDWSPKAKTRPACVANRRATSGVDPVAGVSAGHAAVDALVRTEEAIGCHPYPHPRSSSNEPGR
jgi:hypothetical protein